MRDGDNDDDAFRNEISKGRILHSGITPDNPGPAEYALGEGVPALMEESLRTRRAWLLSTITVGFAAGVTGAILSGLFGSRNKGNDSDRDSGPIDPTLSRDEKLWIAGARALADDDIEKLTASYKTFMRVVELYGGDEVLWRGVERLATFSILKDDESAVQIARRILQSFQLRPPPKELEHLVPVLKRLIRPHR